jgi:hypothetical protein
MTDESTAAEHIQTPEAISSGEPATVVPDLPFPLIDLAVANDPVTDIMGSAEFHSCFEFLRHVEAAQRALVSSASQALLYCFIRNLRPDHVVEIGTYKASTTEAMCRALHANGHGIAHTVDPNVGVYGVEDILAAWPPELKQHVQFYPVSSMDFYIRAIQTQLRPQLVFVDGHHDYEFASFDIQCAARLMLPNGFIFVDNIAQPGPYFAARDFLNLHPDWRECGSSMSKYRPELPFDLNRRSVEHTDFCVLGGPRHIFIGIEPYTPGISGVANSEVDSISVTIARPATGKLYAQCILRSFGDSWIEEGFERSIQFVGVTGEVRVPLHMPYRAELLSVPRTVEPWLTWEGDMPLELTTAPKIY